MLINEQIKSQILGISLAVATSVGCIFYERMVKYYSFTTIAFIKVLEALLLLSLSYSITRNSSVNDEILNAPKSILWGSLIFLFTGVTGYLWYLITRNQSVMVSSLYEVKYIVILAVFYSFFGAEKLTINTLIGLVLALCSIYFVSKK